MLTKWRLAQAPRQVEDRVICELNLNFIVEVSIFYTQIAITRSLLIWYGWDLLSLVNSIDKRGDSNAKGDGPAILGKTLSTPTSLCVDGPYYCYYSAAAVATIALPAVWCRIPAPIMFLLRSPRGVLWCRPFAIVTEYSFALTLASIDVVFLLPLLSLPRSPRLLCAATPSPRYFISSKLTSLRTVEKVHIKCMLSLLYFL